MQLQLVMMNKFFKFGFNIFNTFWIMGYIKFLHENDNKLAITIAWLFVWNWWAKKTCQQETPVNGFSIYLISMVARFKASWSIKSLITSPVICSATLSCLSSFSNCNAFLLTSSASSIVSSLMFLKINDNVIYILTLYPLNFLHWIIHLPFLVLSIIIF